MLDNANDDEANKLFYLLFFFRKQYDDEITAPNESLYEIIIIVFDEHTLAHSFHYHIFIFSISLYTPSPLSLSRGVGVRACVSMCERADCRDPREMINKTDGRIVRSTKKRTQAGQMNIDKLCPIIINFVDARVTIPFYVSVVYFARFSLP